MATRGSQQAVWALRLNALLGAQTSPALALQGTALGAKGPRGCTGFLQRRWLTLSLESHLPRAR